VGAIVRELRESPQAVEEEPQRAESPGLRHQVLRRTYRGRGGGGGSVADDEQQRRLEVVKLRIDVLKHITTLSGAATVILLALAERVKGIQANTNLWMAAFLFGSSTLVALVLITQLLHNIDRTETIPRFQGQRGTAIVTTMFVVSASTLLWTGLGVSLGLLVIGGIIVAISVFIGSRIYRYLQRRRDSGVDEGEDPEAG
jgi:hypothetical protein